MHIYTLWHSVYIMFKGFVSENACFAKPDCAILFIDQLLPNYKTFISTTASFPVAISAVFASSEQRKKSL